MLKRSRSSMLSSFNKPGRASKNTELSDGTSADGKDMVQMSSSALSASEPAAVRVLDHLNITELPNEILCMLFARLDDCSSVCLGLTQRLLWKLHLEFSRPGVSLYARSESFFLYQLLGDWMTEDRRFCHWFKGGRFIKSKEESVKNEGGNANDEEGVVPKRCGCLGCSPNELAKLVKFQADVKVAELKLGESKKLKTDSVRIRKEKLSDRRRRQRTNR